jgi:hypothetical protein
VLLIAGDRYILNKDTVKCKAFPATGLDRPLGFQEAEAPEFLDSRQKKVVRLSALRTGRLTHGESNIKIINVSYFPSSKFTFFT